MLEENVIVPFLGKFDRYPFRVKINRKEYKIGTGEPEFTVDFKKPVSLPALVRKMSSGRLQAKRIIQSLIYSCQIGQRRPM